MGRSSSDHVAQLVASQRHVERKFEPETFFGPIGAAAVRRLSARSSCHAYPSGVSLQVALLGWAAWIKPYIVLDVSRASLHEVAPKALFLWELCIKVVL